MSKPTTRMSFERGLGAETHIKEMGMPSAVIGMLPIVVPLFSVSTIGLTESYHLPPIGSGGDRVMIDTHDDQINISGVLPGQMRYFWKEMLEKLAELSLGWNPYQTLTKGNFGGLQLWTSMTLRTDIYIQNLSFNASAQKRKALDVSMSLVHLPRNPGLTLGLELGNMVASTAADPFGGS